MKKKNKLRFIVGALLVIIALALGVVLTNTGGEKSETISVLMKDAVLHEENKMSLFGIADVNPSVISGFVVTAILLAFAAAVRVFAIPKFTYIPGKFQLLIEKLVGFFDDLAKSNSPHRNKFLGAYVFAAGVYIFIGTIFELFGLQGVTTTGMSMALPAPLSDINGAISIGCLSYLVILGGGLVSNGLRGVGQTLKDFSLPISMSFRLFGALLSGLLVTELVYYYIALSFVLPVIVGVLFTLLHALIQTYVLTMLTTVFYGEVTEPRKGEAHVRAPKRKKSTPSVTAAQNIIKPVSRVE